MENNTIESQDHTIKSIQILLSKKDIELDKIIDAIEIVCRKHRRKRESDLFKFADSIR